MANDVAAASQWEERNGKATAPSISHVYLKSSGGVITIDDDPAEANTYLQTSAGVTTLDTSSTGARTTVKHGPAIISYA